MSTLAEHDRTQEHTSHLIPPPPTFADDPRRRQGFERMGFIPLYDQIRLLKTIFKRKNRYFKDGTNYGKILSKMKLKFYKQTFLIFQ